MNKNKNISLIDLVRMATIMISLPFVFIFELYQKIINIAKPGIVSIENAVCDSVEYRWISFNKIMDNYDTRFRYKVAGHRKSSDSDMSFVLSNLIQQGFIECDIFPDDKNQRKIHKYRKSGDEIPQMTNLEDLPANLQAV